MPNAAASTLSLPLIVAFRSAKEFVGRFRQNATRACPSGSRAFALPEIRNGFVVQRRGNHRGKPGWRGFCRRSLVGFCSAKASFRGAKGDDRLRGTVLPRTLTVLRVALLVIVGWAHSIPCQAADQTPPKRVRVVFKSDAKTTVTADARVWVKAADGGMLIETRDGRIWAITPERLTSFTELDEDFQAVSASELADVLALELKNAGVVGALETVTTPHYVIVTNTSRVYAEWCGQILERLFVSFDLFAKEHGFTLIPQSMPLPVIVLANQTQFANFAKVDATPLSAKGQGYYSITSNRVVLYDLTTAKGQPVVRTRDEVIKRLRLATSNVATVVHEATHQLAFNRGLNRRYADNPHWLTEGLAMHFEAADFLSDQEPVEIGKLNTVRLKRLLDAQRARRIKSVETLIRDSKRFSQADTAVDAYAEAWLLTHYLLTTEPKAYVSYVSLIAEKPLLQTDSAEEHLADFEAAFSKTEQMDANLRQYLLRLRGP